MVTITTNSPQVIATLLPSNTTHQQECIYSCLLGTAHWVAASFFFLLNQCPEAVAAAKTKLIPFLIGQKATYHCPPTAKNCRDKYLPWLCTPGSRPSSLIYLLLSIAGGHTGSAELESCTCAQFCIPARSKMYWDFILGGETE